MCDFSETTVDARDTSLTTCCKVAAEEIIVLRQSVDNFDNAIIALLAERFKTMKRIGELKAEAGFAPEDSKREQQQIESLLNIAENAGLDSSIALKYHEFVVTEAKKRHQQMQS